MEDRRLSVNIIYLGDVISGRQIQGFTTSEEDHKDVVIVDGIPVSFQEAVTAGAANTLNA